jgi:hypothetical protein
MNSNKRQITNTILMIRPAHFGYNPETAQNNSFQRLDESMTPAEIAEKTQEEFSGFVDELRYKGVQVIVVEDTDTPIKPDAVFPNNWISFHQTGVVVQYPMYSKTRRQERRSDIIEILQNDYVIERDYTFEHYEEEETFLEGTGSMILDRQHRIAYACLSERTDIRLLEKWCVLLGYHKLAFTAVDRHGDPIYHTNVMMALGEDFVVICLDSVQDESERNLLVSSLERSGKEIIEISYEQMESFAGNMLQVSSAFGPKYLVMSETAYQSLNEEQIEKIKKRTDIIHFPIPTIEKYGGGSVRCMMAEVFLPKKK